MNYTDDVNGVIIGGENTFYARLYYNERPQGNICRGNTQEEALNKAGEYLDTLKQEYGSAFFDIYPLKAWEVRIFEF